MTLAVDDPLVETALVKKALKSWDLKRLLGLQDELTREIEDRVQLLEIEIETLKGRKGVEDGLKRGGKFPLVKVEEKENLPFHQEHQATTQLTHVGKKRKISSSGAETGNVSAQSSQTIEAQEEFLIPGTLDMQSKDINFSSPLKPAQTDERKSEKSSPTRHHLAVISDSEGELEWSDTEDQRDSLKSGPVQVKTEPERRHDDFLHNVLKCEPPRPSKPSKPKVVFNANPFSKRPWIFEDFKANDAISSSAKPGTNFALARISRFQSATGVPVLNQKVVLNPHKGFELVTEEPVIIPTAQTSHGVDEVFDNLRQRSKSPPGYGRLDFPNTQENDADIVKSREILYNKTKDRFLMATRSDLSPSKRDFVFRNVQLNDIVNKGDFEWDMKSLQIFCRAKVRN
ncbi:ssDNA endodeoxyribonuclease SAE2 LALA0_S01e12640g [Lachancea lanzarotensis]|uniref:LALA0S01e12640g1_1 n=1 Tax=Lachancea lanzarotensis TaxID=1245769 RepID=A0A0C7N502_9SACH|nr:uncharacterized protein LALA0_S01e12640g [Lachancea lanzarotensis]CEP60513.1 LALA0S01e12640g1_1 [Lachancea lanzarotensis]